MSARGAMKMRATVERSAAQPANPWGQPGVPVYTERGEIPCYVWSTSRREVRTDGTEAVIEDLRAIVPANLAKTVSPLERDRLTIRDRRGNPIFDGPIAVKAVAAKAAASGNGKILELILERHTP